MPVVKIKSVYEQVLNEDGYRVFIDRLWPHGMDRAFVGWNEWAKELAPSVYLRKWFDHDVELWCGFQKRYVAELKRNSRIAHFVAQHSDKDIITLVYASKDPEHNHALILREYLQCLFQA